MSADRIRTVDQYRDASNLGVRIAVHERFSTNPRGFHRWVFDHVDLSEVARILEIGCGPGTLWVENRKRIPHGWNITLTDASPGMVGEARQSLGDSRPFRFMVTDAQKLPFADESFDAVIAGAMLHLLPDRGKAFSEIVRVLRNSGRLYATTSGTKHMRELAAMLRVLDPGWPHESVSPDLSNFNLQNGAGQLSQWFNEVTLLRYEDSLTVTEAKPLVSYLLSGMHAQALTERLPDEEFQERVSTLEVSLERELTARGSIHVTKDTGMFVASS